MYFPGLHLNKTFKRGIALWAIILLCISPVSVIAEGDEGSAIPPETTNTTPLVETGVAAATSDANNAVNVNTVDTNSVPTETESVQPASSGEETPASLDSTSTLPEVSAETENTAVIGNSSNTTAETGENATVGEGGEIQTGSAYAASNTLNLVNVNVFDSATLFLLLNHFFNLNGNVDFREYGAGEQLHIDEGSCGNEMCAVTAPNSLNASSTADISNAVVVRASTGENTASGDGSTISTGNAYAGANVVNVVNTNIVDSNYLLLTFNNLGSLTGDVILPSHNYFSDFFFKTGGMSTSASLSTSNHATIENAISIEANTGDNNVVGNGASITTGSAYGISDVFNQVNSNLFGGGELRVLIRVHGSWLGQLFNVPEGVQWKETPWGIELYSNNPGTSSSPSPSVFNLSSLNTASLYNNVTVQALTGTNEIKGDGSIETGNAYAGANIINVANTNVFSANYMLAMIDIFGDWNGNLSFGQPDLWVGAWAETIGEGSGEGFAAGKPVRLHVTVANRGDADASGIILNSEWDKQFMIFPNTYESSVAHRTTWTRDRLAAGETVELVYDGKIRDDIPLGWFNAEGLISVKANETDADLKDNSDTLSLTAGHFRVGDGSGSQITLSPDPVLKVTKTHDVFFPTTGTTTANYKITIVNEGGIAHYATLVDRLKDEEGNIINEQSWDLGDIYPNEEITITYTNIFANGMAPGDYTNYATLRAIGRSAIVQPFYGAWFKSVATSTITILPPFDWAPETPFVETAPEVATSSVESNLPEKDNTTQGKSEELPVEVQEQAPPIAQIPFSPLLFKVFAFRDSITPTLPPHGGAGASRVGDNQAAVFHAVSSKNLEETLLLVLAFILSLAISETLLSRTRLRNAFTSF